MAIERRLTEIAGPVGGKLHTARSRNDQVATDMALFVREQAEGARRRLCELMGTLTDLAERHADWPMPGYTHLQRAQPVYLGHHLLAYFWMFRRDVERFAGRRLRDRGAAPRRGRARRRQLGHPARLRRARARLRRRGGELPRRRLQPRLRARLPERRGDLRDAPVAARRGDRAVVERGVRLPRAGGLVHLGLEHHAAEEEPRRRGAAARQGAPRRRRPVDPAGRDARAAAGLQQGHAGGQGAPVRRGRHAEPVPGGGHRDAPHGSLQARAPRGRRRRRVPGRDRHRRPARAPRACRSGSRTRWSPGSCGTRSRAASACPS